MESNDMQSKSSVGINSKCDETTTDDNNNNLNMDTSIISKPILLNRKSNVELNSNKNIQEFLTSDTSDDEEMDVDNHMFCDDCGEFQIGECKIHGPYVYMKDTMVEMDVKDRAKLTSPNGISIGKAAKEKKSLSAWTVKSFTKNTVFGPYEGREREGSKKKNIQLVFEGGVVWEIYTKGEISHYIDASNARKSNWMRYVKCANAMEAHNLIAYQYQGNIFYRLCKDVGKGEKLLIQQKDEYTEHLGIPAKYKDEVEEAQYECTTCRELFQNEDTLSEHMRKHIRKIPKTLHCNQCNYTCMQASSLSNHQLTHSSSKKFPCKFCDCFFGTRKEMKRHAATHLEKDAKVEFRCDLCGKTFHLQESLTKHIKSSHDTSKGFKCELCTQIFSTEAELEEHLQNHPLTYKQTDDEDKKNDFSCSWCDKTFTTNYRLKRHAKSVHKQTSNTCILCGFNADSFDDLKAHEDTHMREEVVLKCKQCEESFPSFAELKEHVSTNHPDIPLFKCDYCSYSSVRNGDLQRHQYIHNKKKSFKCEICDKTFGRKYTLNNHMGIHMEEKKYKCTACDKSFMAEYRLKRHVQNVHETVKTYSCKECGDIFDEKQKLSEHMKMHPIKSYTCVFCGKSISGKYYLNTHLKLHNAEKLHKCDQCEKCFHTKGVLKKHVENVHLKIKRHCCDICKAFFSQKGQLTAHIRTHTGERPYLCKYCGKRFGVSSHLRQHERIHTGETPYMCTFCNKGFRRYHHLRQHEMWHTGEKPHQCQYCEKHFAVRGNMLQHERTHTGERPFKCKHCKKGFGHHSVMRTHEKTHEKELATFMAISPPPPPASIPIPQPQHLPHGYMPAQLPGMPARMPYMPPGQRMDHDENYSMILNCMH